MGHDRGILDDGPMPLPSDWLSLVIACQAENVLEEIRKDLLKH